MDVATFAVYNETAMIRLLERVVSEYTDKPTIVLIEQLSCLVQVLDHALGWALQKAYYLFMNVV